MKKLTFALALAASLAASAEMKIGTVDMLLLVRNHPNYESNKALLTDTEKDYSKKVNRLKDEVTAIEEEGKKLADQLGNPMLAQSAKTQLEKELKSVQTRYVSAQQKMRSEAMRSQQDLQDLEARLLKTTSEDLRKRIATVAETEGYDLVLDASAAPYAKKDLDVTPLVLKALGVDPEKAKNPVEEKKEKSDEGK